MTTTTSCFSSIDSDGVYRTRPDAAIEDIVCEAIALAAVLRHEVRFQREGILVRVTRASIPHEVVQRWEDDFDRREELMQ